jgi:predicted nucleotidyltransferase component of viral defense system
MDDVARFPAADRNDLFNASTGKRALNVVIVEKDFWVCWVLKQIFSLRDPPAGLVFKGGTSLSKVWGVIDRFSEDVDLSFNRSDLGFGCDADPARASSTKKRNRQLEQLSAACSAMIRGQFVPRLNEAVPNALGTAAGDTWRLEIDPDDEQSVLFHYPTSAAREPGDEPAYLRPFVKLELGARSEHWPSEEAEIRSFAAEDFPSAFHSPTGRVKVVSVERTFWEKATILHSWYHAGPDRPLRDRQSRHYYDVFRLFQSQLGHNAVNDLELLQSVARHKSLFFASAWARYDQAVPGTLRLVPPDFRLAELERDYSFMRN